MRAATPRSRRRSSCVGTGAGRQAPAPVPFRKADCHLNFDRSIPILCLEPGPGADGFLGRWDEEERMVTDLGAVPGDLCRVPAEDFALPRADAGRCRGGGCDPGGLCESRRGARGLSRRCAAFHMAVSASPPTPRWTGCGAHAGRRSSSWTRPPLNFLTGTRGQASASRLWSSQVYRGEMNDCIRGFIGRLPETYQTVLVLADFENLKNEEDRGGP